MNDTQDNKWDKLLHIKTMGRDDSQSDQYRYPYEPTPYSVLQRLANTGLIRKNNMLLDYGCGKGRVDFFLSYQTRCRCLGVEYDERIYEKVMEKLSEQIDRIYFFNPFSVEILRKVMARIMESYYVHPRQILCFFYYPSDEYFTYLMTVDEMMFTDEIDCSDLFGGNSERERIMIFEIGQ